MEVLEMEQQVSEGDMAWNTGGHRDKCCPRASQPPMGPRSPLQAVLVWSQSIQMSTVKDSYKAPFLHSSSNHCPRLVASFLCRANLNNPVSSAIPLLFQLIMAFREHWLSPNPTNPPLTSFHTKNWLLLVPPIPTSNGSRRTLPLTLEVTQLL